jgi:hypothetical protein
MVMQASVCQFIAFPKHSKAFPKALASPVTNSPNYLFTYSVCLTHKLPTNYVNTPNQSYHEYYQLGNQLGKSIGEINWNYSVEICH